MKKNLDHKMIRTFVIVDSIWILGALIYFFIFKKFVDIYIIGVFIFTYICIYIGLHDNK